MNTVNYVNNDEDTPTKASISVSRLPTTNHFLSPFQPLATTVAFNYHRQLSPIIEPIEPLKPTMNNAQEILLETDRSLTLTMTKTFNRKW
jgi:hypothetical protein